MILRKNKYRHIENCKQKSIDPDSRHTHTARVHTVFSQSIPFPIYDKQAHIIHEIYVLIFNDSFNMMSLCARTTKEKKKHISTIFFGSLVFLFLFINMNVVILKVPNIRRWDFTQSIFFRMSRKRNKKKKKKKHTLTSNNANENL